MAVTKAEKAFNDKRAEALEQRDFSKLRTLFNQYGTYLELVDDGAPVTERKTVTHHFKRDGRKLRYGAFAEKSA